MMNGTTNTRPLEEQPGCRSGDPVGRGEARRGGVPFGALGAVVGEDEYPWVCRATGPRFGQRCRYAENPRLGKLARVVFKDGVEGVYPRSNIRLWQSTSITSAARAEKIRRKRAKRNPGGDGILVTPTDMKIPIARSMQLLDTQFPWLVGAEKLH